jgi:hypothetical protein
MPELTGSISKTKGIEMMSAGLARWGFAAMGAALLSGCASNGASSGTNMVAEFHDMSKTQLSVRSAAPPDVVREYAICKAVWMAEKPHVAQISLSNPVYGPPTMPGPVPFKFPDGWVSLEATAYLGTVGPDGNPLFSVEEKAGPCRRGWDWYR